MSAVCRTRVHYNALSVRMHFLSDLFALFETLYGTTLTAEG